MPLLTNPLDRCRLKPIPLRLAHEVRPLTGGRSQGSTPENCLRRAIGFFALLLNLRTTKCLGGMPVLLDSLPAHQCRTLGLARGRQGLRFEGYGHTEG
jgi:hypothetical protein